MNGTDTPQVLDDHVLAEQYRHMVVQATGLARQAKALELAAQTLMREQAAARARWPQGTVLVREAAKLLIRGVNGELVGMHPDADQFVVHYSVSDWLGPSKKWSARTRRVSEQFLLRIGWVEQKPAQHAGVD